MPTKSNNTGGRGGARPGAGRKKSAVKEKAENGNPGGRRLEVLDIPEVEGVDMPKPHEFLSAEQRDGSTLQAEEIYKETWEWLKKIGCAASASIDYIDVGKAAGQAAAEILGGKSASDIPVAVITEPTNYYNSEVCELLGLTVPDTIDAADVAE